MNGIDLFAGAGGMSIGAQLSGINVIAAVDSDKEAMATYSHNFKHSNIFCRDIRDVSYDDFKIQSRTEPLVVFGGPPCQGFSTSNQRTRNSLNPKNWLFLEYIRIVEETLPDAIVFENVRGILETEKGVFLQSVVDSLRALDYRLSWKLLNAADFGVPQNRWRLFLVGFRKGQVFDFPSPFGKTPFTVSDAISDLPLLENGAKHNRLPYRIVPKSTYADNLRGNLKEVTNNLVTKNAEYICERYRHIPQGGNWADIPVDLMKNYKDRSRCHTGIYHRLKSFSPSVVIGNYRKNMLVHPTQNRGLSVREAARLQSFPDWFEFKGTIGSQQQQVGNAVPPLLVKAVFTTVTKVYG